MSFVNKKGKTTTSRKMIIRQQVTDVLAYGKIITTLTKAKETQKHVDGVITLAKKNTLPTIRKMDGIILDNKDMTKKEIIKKVFEYAKKYASRNGGYTRVLKLGTRTGDNTMEAVLELV